MECLHVRSKGYAEHGSTEGGHEVAVVAMRVGRVVPYGGGLLGSTGDVGWMNR